MNRGLLFFYCMLGCVLSGLAQRKMPLSQDLQRALKKEISDTTDIRVLLQAGNAYILRAGTEAGDVDSAKLCAEKVHKSAVRTGNRVWEGQSYLLYATIWRELNDPGKGKSYAERARIIFEKDKQKEYLADADIELCEYYSIWADSTLKVRIAYSQEAARIYGELGLTLRQAETATRIGDYYLTLSDFIKAKDMLLQALPLFKKVGHKEVHGIYDLLGATYYQLGDFDNALKYALLAVKTAEELKDSTSQLSTIYNRLGMIHHILDNERKAMESFQNGLRIAVRLKDTMSMQILTGNLAHAYLKLDKAADALKLMKRQQRDYPANDFHIKAWMAECTLSSYCGLSQYELARPYAQHLEQVRRTLDPNDSFMDQLNVPLGSYYLGIGQHAKAHECGMRVLGSSKRTRRPALEVAAHMLLYKADSAVGKYQEAFEHFRMFKIVNDSVFSVSKMRQISSLQLQYETDLCNCASRVSSTIFCSLSFNA